MTDHNYAALGEDVFSDTEFFFCYRNHDDSSHTHSSKTVFNTLFHFYTSHGKNIAKEIISAPITDIDTLYERQKLLYGISRISYKNKYLLQHFRNVSANNDRMEQITSAEVASTYKDVLYSWRYLTHGNKYPLLVYALNIYRMIVSPVTGTLSPLSYLLTPYLVMWVKFGVRMDPRIFIQLFLVTIRQQPKYWIILSVGVSIFMYLQGIYNSVVIAYTIHTKLQQLSEYVQAIVSTLKSAYIINTTLWNSQIPKTFRDACSTLLSDVEERKYIQSLPRKIDLEYQFKTCGFHTSLGTLVHTFTTLRENGAIIQSIMTKTRILDALYAFAALPKDKYVYTEFVRDAQYPLCIMKDVKHPVLSNPVGNNVSINRDAPQMIITGPNAGGKSTMVKTILINILLSQTIGMAYCRHMYLAPYHCIHTQMNIPDEKGHASLFEAEMHRCKEKLDILQRLPEHHKALFVMDEIFNSTNYVEGVSGAYAIIKRLGTSPSRNTTVIFTTHYGYLTSLETMHPRCFINYRMNVQTSPDFLFPYKLEKGISQQYIALELLKRNGFHNEIVEDALTIKKSVAEASLEMTNNIMGREQT